MGLIKMHAIAAEVMCSRVFCSCRCLSFVSEKLGGRVPRCESLSPEDARLFEQVERLLEQYVAAFEAVHQRDALQTTLNVARAGNQFIQANVPWALLKSGSEKDRYLAMLTRAKLEHTYSVFCATVFSYIYTYRYAFIIMKAKLVQ